MEAISQVGGPPRRAGLAELGPVYAGLGAGAALAVLRAVNGESYDRALLPSVAFGIVVAVPGLLALMARSRRPGLYLAAGLAYLPAGFLSFAGVTLPLLLVGAMAFVAYGRHSEEETPLVWAPLTAMVIFIITIATFAVLLFVSGDDARCVSTPTSQSCTSDVITNAEALAALGLVALILVAAWFLSWPQRQGVARKLSRPERAVPAPGR